MIEQIQCPCGNNALLADCCGPVIDGSKNAATAEALMRSRYSANVLRDGHYLLASWHESTRPATLDPATIPQWVRLEIIAVQAGTVSDHRGTVEFKATWLQGKNGGVLHERSRFVRKDGKWFYIDGKSFDTETISPGTVGRNAPCPCGSGKKYKKCCLQR